MVRAPELVGHGGWIGTDGELSLRALRGKVVVLNFWTFACAKCIRVIVDLEELHSRFPGEVVVIGVHSPKFPFAGEHRAVTRAVVRLDLTHPVLDDMVGGGVVLPPQEASSRTPVRVRTPRRKFMLRLLCTARTPGRGG